MNKYYSNILLLAAGIFLISIISCKKNNIVVDKDPLIPPTVAKFLTSPSAPVRFEVSNTNTNTQIPVSITTVSSVDRTVTVSVESPTGAQSGTHFTAPTSIVIPAGEVIANLPVNVTLSYYDGTCRRDTLVFTITDGEVKAAAYNTKYSLLVSGICSESKISCDNGAFLLGEYTKTFENGSYGPYSSFVEEIEPVTATSARVTINRIYDYDEMRAQIIIDWSVPGNYTVTVVPGFDTGYTAGGNTLYAGPQTSGAVGSFKYCDNELTIPLRLYTIAGGTLDQWVMTMAR